VKRREFISLLGGGTVITRPHTARAAGDHAGFMNGGTLEVNASPGPQLATVSSFIQTQTH
jgi:hypothetical protein